MNYEFTLDEKAAISLIAGSVVFAILLFTAGWIVGMQWSPGSSAALAATTKKEEPELPKEPVLKNEAPAAQPAPPKTTAQPQMDQASKTAAAAPQQSALPAKAPAANGEVKIIQETPTDQTGAESPEDYVTVQVGVFLDEQEANHLLKKIEKMGYAPSFFSGRDAEARQWYAVRIGSYTDKQQAANAAANFTRQEKIQAVVRPSGSL